MEPLHYGTVIKQLGHAGKQDNAHKMKQTQDNILHRAGHAIYKRMTWENAWRAALLAGSVTALGTLDAHHHHVQRPRAAAHPLPGAGGGQERGLAGAAPRVVGGPPPQQRRPPPKKRR